MDDRAAFSSPLAVDMDGTLLRTDVLVESITVGLFSRPLDILAAVPLLFTKGRAAFKARIHEIAPIDVTALPVRTSLLSYLEGESSRGRELHLVTAADHKMAQKVALRFGIFGGVHGSDGELNLKGARKLERL